MKVAAGMWTSVVAVAMWVWVAGTDDGDDDCGGADGGAAAAVADGAPYGAAAGDGDCGDAADCGCSLAASAWHPPPRDRTPVPPGPAARRPVGPAAVAPVRCAGNWPVVPPVVQSQPPSNHSPGDGDGAATVCSCCPPLPPPFRAWQWLFCRPARPAN